MNAHRLTLAIVAGLCALAGGVALIAPSSAFAVMRHEYLSTITGTSSGPFSPRVCGVTIDPATQDVYVSDPEADSIDIFSSTGKYESQISGMSVPAGAFDEYQACSLAVSDVTHDVYVDTEYREPESAGGKISVIYVFNSVGGYVATIAGSGTPGGIESLGRRFAVDQSTGNIYVQGTGTKKVIYLFNSANQYQSDVVLPKGLYGQEIAVNAEGDIYVSGRDEATKRWGVFEFNGAGTEVGAFYETPSGPLEYTSAMTVDAAGNVYVETILKDGQEAVEEFNSAGAFVDQTLGIPDSVFEIGEGEGLAVNASGDLYVAEQESVDVFGPSVDVPSVTTGAASVVGDTAETVAGTVDPEGVEVTSCEFEYVPDSLYRTAVAEKALNPYEKGGKQPCSSSPGAGSGKVAVSAQLSGLAPSREYDYRLVASNAKGGEGGVNEGEDASFSTSGPPAIESEMAVNETSTGATIEASVYTGEHETEVYVEYGESEAYGQRTAKVKVPAFSLAQTLKIPGVGRAQTASIEVQGLTVGTLYHYRVVAENPSSKGVASVAPDASFQTLPAARIERESVSDVGSTSATLSAQIDDLGTQSTYYYEYGPSVAYGFKTAPVVLSANDTALTVSTQLDGLQPATGYHFRVVVENPLVTGQPGYIAGADVAFGTFPASSELPDGRVYELVSAIGAGKSTEAYVPWGMIEGGTLDPVGAYGLPSEYPFEAAADGDALVYVGTASATSGGNGNVVYGNGEEFLARRSADGGWTQSDLEMPSSHAYEAFSEDLSVGVFDDPGDELAADAAFGYDNLYSHRLAGGAYEPLFTESPEERTPENFGYFEADQLSQKGIRLVGANAGTSSVPAFSHVLFEVSAKLASAPEAPSVNVEENNLYDSVGGRLYLVNVLPNGAPQARATFGRQGHAEASGHNAPVRSNVISADGLRVFWSAVQPVGAGKEERAVALYVRENDTQSQSEVEGEHCTEPGLACTVQVDRAEAGAKGPSGGGQFWAANSTGSRVFFTDESRLTHDSRAGAGQPDLYEYDLEAPEGERLTDLSVPVKGSGGGDVQGMLGTSQDGAYVYFVADGVLSEGKNNEGGEAVEGQPNLYLRHEGRTVFVATLMAGDGNYKTEGSDGEGDWVADAGRRTAEVTPDGQSVVFMSRAPLTGYDNVLDGVPLTEVFVYDAGSGAGPGSLSCASCNPSGEAPVTPTAAFTSSTNSLKEALGSFLPTSVSGVDYQPRVVSDDGSRVFFDSIEPLAPDDSNGYVDVYEWEAPGEGSCTPQTASAVTGGCTYLLSGGQDDENSYLIDASASGDDVFFASRAKLLTSVNGEFDEVFDARVGGVQPPEAARCSGTACQGVPPAPPIFATPASITFSGVGNFPSPVETTKTTKKKTTSKCAKGEKRSHGRCVKVKRSAKKAKAKRASRERRVER